MKKYRNPDYHSIFVIFLTLILLSHQTAFGAKKCKAVTGNNLIVLKQDSKFAASLGFLDYLLGLSDVNSHYFSSRNYQENDKLIQDHLDEYVKIDPALEGSNPHQFYSFITQIKKVPWIVFLDLKKINVKEMQAKERENENKKIKSRYLGYLKFLSQQKDLPTELLARKTFSNNDPRHYSYLRLYGLDEIDPIQLHHFLNQQKLNFPDALKQAKVNLEQLKKIEQERIERKDEVRYLNLLIAYGKLGLPSEAYSYTVFRYKNEYNLRLRALMAEHGITDKTPTHVYDFFTKTKKTPWNKVLMRAHIDIVKLRKAEKAKARQIIDDQLTEEYIGYIRFLGQQSDVSVKLFKVPSFENDDSRHYLYLKRYGIYDKDPRSLYLHLRKEKIKWPDALKRAQVNLRQRQKEEKERIEAELEKRLLGFLTFYGKKKLSADAYFSDAFQRTSTKNYKSAHKLMKEFGITDRSPANLYRFLTVDRKIPWPEARKRAQINIEEIIENEMRLAFEETKKQYIGYINYLGQQPDVPSKLFGTPSFIENDQRHYPYLKSYGISDKDPSIIYDFFRRAKMKWTEVIKLAKVDLKKIKQTEQEKIDKEDEKRFLAFLVHYGKKNLHSEAYGLEAFTNRNEHYKTIESHMIAFGITDRSPVYLAQFFTKKKKQPWRETQLKAGIDTVSMRQKEQQLKEQKIYKENIGFISYLVSINASIELFIKSQFENNNSELVQHIKDYGLDRLPSNLIYFFQYRKIPWSDVLNEGGFDSSRRSQEIDRIRMEKMEYYLSILAKLKKAQLPLNNFSVTSFLNNNSKVLSALDKLGITDTEPLQIVNLFTKNHLYYNGWYEALIKVGIDPDEARQQGYTDISILTPELKQKRKEAESLLARYKGAGTTYNFGTNEVESVNVSNLESDYIDSEIKSMLEDQINDILSSQEQQLFNIVLEYIKSNNFSDLFTSDFADFYFEISETQLSEAEVPSLIQKIKENENLLLLINGDSLD